MKVLTAAQMREVDRRTIEMGIPGIVLMENAGHRVVEFLADKFAPLAPAAHRRALRQGQQRRRWPGGGAAAFHALPDPAVSRGAVGAAGGVEGRCGGESAHAARPAAVRCMHAITPRHARRHDRGGCAARHRNQRSGDRPRCWRRSSAINNDFPLAKVVAVDIPSGHAERFRRARRRRRSRADYTVTFTAPKVGARAAAELR